ncbi:GNAT family N-acetyltransferase [Streptosporangium sp. NPDC004379]|uniref:GNAT family N-acetyltransferase n=1 Tax=Streptosporangium sp. NPDC004379 TaxID=3366189 RepID=UPI00369C3086
MSSVLTDVASEGRMSPLLLANRNAAALWTALAQVRGNEVVQRPGFVGVKGSERGGTRILLLGPDPDEDDLAALTELVRDRRDGKVVVEDQFGTVDLGDLGLTSRRLPVMIRDTAPPGSAGGASSSPPAVEIVRADSESLLETVERVVVHGFPLEGFLPWRPGEVFPRTVLERQDVEFFLVTRDGVPAGACMVILDGTVGGVYWVTTLPEHRSRGIGRMLMHAVLERLSGLPVTLTAATAGKPLYDSLGFDVITQATWWS